MTDQHTTRRRLATVATAMAAATALAGGMAGAAWADPCPPTTTSSSTTTTPPTTTTTPTTTDPAVSPVADATTSPATSTATDPLCPTTTVTTTTPTSADTATTVPAAPDGTTTAVDPAAVAVTDPGTGTSDPGTGTSDPGTGTSDPGTGTATTAPTTCSDPTTTGTGTTTDATPTDPAAVVTGSDQGLVTPPDAAAAAAAGTDPALPDGGGVASTPADAYGTATDVPTGTPVDPSSLPAGTTSWDSDISRSGLSKFKKTPWNNVGASAPVVVASPADPAQKGLRFTIPGGGQRSEIEPNIGSFREGDDRWFGFSVYLPPGFPTNVQTWQLLTQWKNAGTGSPPLELTVGQGAIRLSGGFGRPGGARTFTKTIAAATTGKRIDLVVHVKFSADPAKGSVEAFRDGNRVLPEFRPPGGTLYPNGSGASSYWKMGLYRDRSISQAGTYTLLRARVGTGYAAVTSGNTTGAAAAPAVTTIPIAPASSG